VYRNITSQVHEEYELERDVMSLPVAQLYVHFHHPVLLHWSHFDPVVVVVVVVVVVAMTRTTHHAITIRPPVPLSILPLPLTLALLPLLPLLLLHIHNIISARPGLPELPRPRRPPTRPRRFPEHKRNDIPQYKSKGTVENSGDHHLCKRRVSYPAIDPRQEGNTKEAGEKAREEKIHRSHVFGLST